MKKGVVFPPFDTDDEEDAFLLTLGRADSKDDPEQVLEIIDSKLKRYGLEIRLYECRGDFFEFDIAKRV